MDAITALHNLSILLDPEQGKQSRPLFDYNYSRVGESVLLLSRDTVAHGCDIGVVASFIRKRIGTAAMPDSAVPFIACLLALLTRNERPNAIILPEAGVAGTTLEAFVTGLDDWLSVDNLIVLNDCGDVAAEHSPSGYHVEIRSLAGLCCGIQEVSAFIGKYGRPARGVLLCVEGADEAELRRVLPADVARIETQFAVGSENLLGWTWGRWGDI